MNHLNKSVTGSSMSAGPNGAGFPAPVMAGDDTGSLGLQSGSRTDANALSARDWDILDQMVQDSLSNLTARLLAQEPRATWKAGRTATRAFPLFSYRVFHHLDDDDFDPIVVGVTFTVRVPEIRVVGDISGDESGFVYFDDGCTIAVPGEILAVQDATRVVTDRLAAQDSIVLGAIRNRHPRAVAR